MLLNNLSFNDILELAPVASGTLRPNALTLFSTMKNEMNFLPAWLEHHRAIGFEQFLIWDDASSDGTSAFLDAQADVVVLRSEYGFGESVRYVDPAGKTQSGRFGTYVKVAAPQVYLPNSFVAYLDADEFLILPENVTTVAEVAETLLGRGETSILASLIEFFPNTLDGAAPDFPDSFEGLIAAYPYFEAEQLLRPQQGKSKPKFLANSKTAKLYDAFGVTPPIVRKGWQKIWMSKKAKLSQMAQTSPRHKTPFVFRGADSWQVGSHNANQPPAQDRWLAVAHFVFTHNLKAKAEAAIKAAAHAHGGRKYYGYAQILDKCADRPDGLLSEQSVRYSGPDQLSEIGLIRWE